MKTFTKRELDDIETVEFYLHRFSNKLFSQIEEQAKRSNAQYVAFTNAISSVTLIVGDAQPSNVYCELPNSGNYYDQRTLLVKKLLYFIDDREIINLLKYSTDRMLSSICFYAIGDIKKVARQNGYHFISLDLHDAVATQGIIVK